MFYMNYKSFNQITTDDILKYTENLFGAFYYTKKYLEAYGMDENKQFNIKLNSGATPQTLYSETQAIYESKEFRNWFSKKLDDVKNIFESHFTSNNQIYAYRGIKTEKHYVDDLTTIPKKIDSSWTIKKESAHEYNYRVGDRPLNIVFGAYFDINNIDWMRTLTHHLPYFGIFEQEINPIIGSIICLDLIEVNGNSIDIRSIKNKQFEISI